MVGKREKRVELDTGGDGAKLEEKDGVVASVGWNANCSHAL